jgi:serine/threonine protein kinase
MVTEYMPNGSLQERVPKPPLEPQQALDVLRPLAEALDYAHEQGVVHRDVKPANVFLDAEWQPVLADFGLAKMYSEDSITMSGVVSGTPSHMAPEQARGSDPTGATDQYALAVIAFQLLTARLPFTGASVMDILYQHVNEPPPAPSSFNPKLSPRVDAVIARGLAKDPTQRWETCETMVKALAVAFAPPDDNTVLMAPEPVRVARPAGASARRVLLTGLALPTPGIPSPDVSPVQTRHLSVEPPSPLVMGSSVTVTGDGLDAKLSASAGVLQGGAVHPIAAGMQVLPDGSYKVTGVVPTDLQPGAATLVACNFDSAGRSKPLSSCAQLAVVIKKG